MNTPESEIRLTKKAPSFWWAALAIVALAGGVAIGYNIWRIKQVTTDPPANYVLYFGDGAVGDKVKVDVTAFTAALTSPAPRWCANLQISGQGAFTCPSPPPVSPTVHLLQRFEIHELNEDSGGAPCTMHVTQKVGLDTLDQVNRVMATIQQQ